MLLLQLQKNTKMLEYVLSLTITSCIHMARAKSHEDLNPAIGSGVIVRYKYRYFLCTVAHFTKNDGSKIYIYTGRNDKNGHTETYEFESGGFTYISELSFIFEEEPDAEDLQCFLENPNNGKYLDVAYREISLLDNIVQSEKTLNLDGFGELKIPYNGKSIILVDNDSEINVDTLCSFFGRIRPDLSKGILDFEEMLYWGLPITAIEEIYVEFDLGNPICDYSRFKGCSGAPIIDSTGKLIALVAKGSPEGINSYKIYGFRFDVIKKWIELTHFSLENK